MLEWMENELHALEKVGGMAIILAHVPNIDECSRQIGVRWHALMDRYQTVVRFGVQGHIHKEQWQVQRSTVDKKPIGMNFIVGSATSYQDKPPSFNVVYLHPENLLPVEYETWALDLDYTNQHDQPKWELKYNYKDTYDLPDLSPESFHKYALNMLDNESLAIKFRNHRHIDHL